MVETDRKLNKQEYGLLVREKENTYGSIIRTVDDTDFYCHEGVFNNFVLHSSVRDTPDYPNSLRSLLKEEIENLPTYRLRAVTGSLTFIKR